MMRGRMAQNNQDLVTGAPPIRFHPTCFCLACFCPTCLLPTLRGA